MNHALIVEDLPEIRAWLGQVARAAFPDLQVVTAGRRDQALACVQQGAFDLALVDLGLPVMSGFELARRLRSRCPDLRTRMVALSGYGQDADIQASHEAGFDEHLTKPPDPLRLQQLLAGGPRSARQSGGS